MKLLSITAMLALFSGVSIRPIPPARRKQRRPVEIVKDDPTIAKPTSALSPQITNASINSALNSEARAKLGSHHVVHSQCRRDLQQLIGKGLSGRCGPEGSEVEVVAYG
ncbi:uncharacterized protein RAG0_05983 [Rhynchosporium agropyri]|uniref:Uncharacterized protein n=1 Tax=Rhynchosporium agropyri TaxID=914238 RepID=A0A1E1KFH0_9HELO|nr:uncharacterized protein RAG0_05983 [Rhynchosporium agropyri]